MEWEAPGRTRCLRESLSDILHTEGHRGGVDREERTGCTPPSSHVALKALGCHTALRWREEGWAGKSGVRWGDVDCYGVA